MKKIVCDRCKKEIEQKKKKKGAFQAFFAAITDLFGGEDVSFDYIIGKPEEWSDGKRVFPADICPECEKQFVEWFLHPDAEWYFHSEKEKKDGVSLRDLAIYEDDINGIPTAKNRPGTAEGD